MKTTTKRTVSAAASFAAVGAIVLGAFTFATAAQSAPAPAETPVVAEEVYVGTGENGLAAEQEAEAAAAEAARIEAERVAAEAAAAEAARIAAEQEAARVAAEQEAARQAEATQRQTSQTSGGGESVNSPVAPAAPAPEPARRCPGGTVAMGSDGHNDTSCLPEGCLNGTVDSSRPECLSPFRP